MLKYAKELGTPEIAREIEREIYRRRTLSDKAKSLLKKAKPYIVKALIVAAFSTVLVGIVLVYGILHILLALYVGIALSFHIYLLKRFILKDIPRNSSSYNKRSALFSGLASLYCFAVFADIVAGNGYFLTSQLLFSIGAPLILFQEVCAIACNIVSVCQSSELVQITLLFCASFLLGYAIGALICMVGSMNNSPSTPDNHPDVQEPEPLSRLELMLIRRAINESLNDVQLEQRILEQARINIDTSLRSVRLEPLRNINIDSAMMM